MKIIRSYIDNIGKAQPGIAAEKEHIERPSERSLQFRSDILQPSQFLRCQMTTLALHIFNLILTKRIFLQFKQILINRQVDISFQDASYAWQSYSGDTFAQEENVQNHKGN